jgi:hypothetical protein
MKKKMQNLIFFKNGKKKSFCECGSLTIGYDIQSFQRRTCCYNKCIIFKLILKINYLKKTKNKKKPLLKIIVGVTYPQAAN